MRRTHASTWALGSLGCFLTAVLVWVLAFRVELGGELDGEILSQFTGRYGQGYTPASTIASLCDPVPFALFLLALGVAGAVAGRRRDALFGIGAALAAAVTSQLLKPVLAEGRDESHLPRPDAVHVSDAAWPSGHSTAAVSLALVLVLLAPPGRRLLALGLGAGFAVAVAGSMLVLGWHYPSDTLGGAAVAGAWFCAALALSRRR
jgi:membrane-associated phospholipid phosphatase